MKRMPPTGPKVIGSHDLAQRTLIPFAWRNSNSHRDIVDANDPVRCCDYEFEVTTGLYGFGDSDAGNDPRDHRSQGGHRDCKYRSETHN